MQRDDQKYDVFQIKIKMIKTNQAVICEQCKSDKNNKIAGKSYHQKFLRAEFLCYGYSLSQTDKLVVHLA